MRGWIRWFLIGVLTLDVIGAAVLLTGALPVVHATEGDRPEDAADRDALELLGHELAERAEVLLRREAELDELLRGAEVERRLTALDEERRERIAAAAEGAAMPAEEATTSPAFVNLQRAYENMEPESAAAALAELAALDEEAVLQLLAGWKPRTSGQILDALTQTDPELAGRLSYQIWKRSGKIGAPAANDGR